MTGKELFEATVGKMTALYPQINQDVLEANIERMFLEHNLEKTDIENPAFDDFQKELDLYFNRLIAFSNPEEEIFESPILKDNTADATPILEEQLKLLIQQAQIRERELAIKYDEEISRSDDENTALKVQISNLVAENLKLKRTAAMVPELEQEILSQQSMIVEQGLMIASLEREGKHTLSDLTSENKLLNLAQTENDELRKAKAKLEKEPVTFVGS